MSELKPMDESLAEAIQCDDVAFIRARAERGEPLDGVYRKKWGPMVMAARHGVARVGAELLRLGASVNEPGPAGNLPIHFCADDEEPAMMALLLAAGADPNAVNDFGQTPLMRAAGSRSLQTAKLLLDAGALVNARDQSGDSALLSVCRSLGSKDAKGMVDLLLAASADPNVIDADGDSALIYALQETSDDMALALLKAGANPTLGWELGRSALSRARGILSDEVGAGDARAYAAASAVAGWETSELGRAARPANASARSLRV